MPPASYVGSAAGTCSNADLEVAFALPAAAKERDTIIAIVGAALPNAGPNVDDLDPAWELVDTLPNGGNTFAVWILRRAAEPDELGNVAIPFPDGFPAGGLAVLGVWRNLNTGADAVDSSSANVAASTNFACPSIVLSTFSDLYIGIAFVTSGAVVVTAPGAGTMRIQTTGGGHALAAFDVLLEASGATGTKTATTAAPQSGIAAALALAADPIVGFGKSFTVDPVGTLGLPAKGI